MNTFATLKELLARLQRNEKLLTEMFRKRQLIENYKYSYALNLLNGRTDELDLLIEKGVLRENGENLTIDSLYLTFFEEVLAANEEINVALVDDKLKTIWQNMYYYLHETDDREKYKCLNIVKNTFRRIDDILLSNIVKLESSVNNTVKSESNYKVKIARLYDLDDKRKDIYELIKQTEKLIVEDSPTFFSMATDEELRRIIVHLREQLKNCAYFVGVIEKGIINYLNKVQHQNNPKLRKLKLLNDRLTIREETNIREALHNEQSLFFEPNPSLRFKLSLDWLQTDEEAFEIIKKVARQTNAPAKPEALMAGSIPDECLSIKAIEEVQINLEKLKNNFVAGSNHLFDFVQNYSFGKELSFEERVDIYCQIASEYYDLFEITEIYEQANEVEFAIIKPK